ncbi:MAG: pyridoxal phosphate-dependent aminotransferase [Burkholderiaceae bacterium]
MPIPFTPLVARLPAAIPFVGPETLERQRGRVFRARIGANESAFGISPRALEAMRAALAELSWYGDPENHDLRTALAGRLGIGIDAVCVDAGIDSLLGLCVRMTVEPGMAVVTSHGAYPTFNYHVAGFDGALQAVPYRDDREDPQALLERQRETGAPLVYFANPDNPMGTWHDADTVQGLIDSVPDGCLLILDEAYHEFAPTDALPPIDTTNPRVVRMRTFSKAYGMAGARVAYAIGHPEVITGLNKIRNQFAVNRVAQAGALASLHDDSFLAQVREAVREGRDRIHALARRHDLPSLPSATNFVAVDLGSTQRAQAMLQALAQADIFIRMPGVAPLNRCLRVGVGTPREHAIFESAFERILPTLPSR